MVIANITKSHFETLSAVFSSKLISGLYLSN